MKKIIFLIVILALGVALGMYLQHKPQTGKIENQVQQAAGQAGAEIQAGAKKVDEAATNIAADVKAGAQKADQVVTNAVGEVKDKLN